MGVLEARKRWRKAVRKRKAKRAAWRRWRERAANRLAALKRAKERRRSNREWGGSRYYTNKAIRIVGDRAPVTSRKRTEDFGNPGSDHHVSQTWADAVDFGIAEAHALKNEVAQRLGADDPVPDYGTWTTRRWGRTYRHQVIAGTHGTGPHFHYGVRRVA